MWPQASFPACQAGLPVPEAWWPVKCRQLRVLVIAAPSPLDWSTPALPVVSSVRDRLLYTRMQISFPAEVLQWCRCRKTLSLLWSLMVKTSYLAQAGGWRLVPSASISARLLGAKSPVIFL